MGLFILYLRGLVTLSFDVSVIDVAMLIAIIVLFTLYTTKAPKETILKKRILRKTQLTKETTKNLNSQNLTNENTNSNTKADCPHFFGYLKTTKEKGVPQECVGCTNLVECLVASKE